jgi:glycosyltransferase involved in cell wall biosynthesis
MKNPKFSIVCPVYSQPGPNFDRRQTVPRAIRSILNQQFHDWELILVDDGCQDEMPQILDEWAAKDKRIRVVTQQNMNRAVARNKGMDNAKGEWICWLDSDDEYSSHYLRALDKAINEFPEYNIFNFTSIIYFPDHRSHIREVFHPKVEGEGHEWFRSGHIATGSFIFRRDLWSSSPKYRIPDEASPYAFAAVSGFDMRIPERPELFTDPAIIEAAGALNCGDSLGNPWGDDALQFYLLTRDNLSKPLDIALYIQYPRASEDSFDCF